MAIQTTGPDLAADALFELSLRRFVFDAAGVITAFDGPYGWLEDPRRPIAEDLARLGGVDDAMVAGRSIDDAVAWFLLRTADLVVAWGAEQVRPWVEARLPAMAGRNWACVRTDLDWAAHGLSEDALVGLAQADLAGPRRAGDDVDGVLSILSHVLDDGRSVLAALLEQSGGGWDRR